MGPPWPSCPARRVGRSNLAHPIQAQQGRAVPGQARPQSPGRAARGARVPPGASCCKTKGRRQETPNRLVLARRGSQAPQPLRGRGWGSHFHPGSQGLPPPLAGAGPIISSSPGSPTLDGPKKKQNGKNHPGNSIWSRNLQGPRVPGSLAGGGAGQGMQRVGAQGEGCRGGWSRSQALSQDGHGEGQPGDAAMEGHAPPGPNSGSGKMLRRQMQAPRPARPRARGAVCMATERGPETGPFKSGSPSARPPTPNHHIQDSWAEPAGLLGFGGGVGHTAGRIPPRNAASTSHQAELRVCPALPPTQMSQGPDLPLPPPQPLHTASPPVKLRGRPRQAEGGGGWRVEGGGCTWPPAGSWGERDVTSLRVHGCSWVCLPAQPVPLGAEERGGSLSGL